VPLQLVCVSSFNITVLIIPLMHNLLHALLIIFFSFVLYNIHNMSHILLYHSLYKLTVYCMQKSHFLVFIFLLYSAITLSETFTLVITTVLTESLKEWTMFHVTRLKNTINIILNFLVKCSKKCRIFFYLKENCSNLL
jgi:hypothetical protein